MSQVSNMMGKRRWREKNPEQYKALVRKHTESLRTNRAYKDRKNAAARERRQQVKEWIAGGGDLGMGTVESLKELEIKY